MSESIVVKVLGYLVRFLSKFQSLEHKLLRHQFFTSRNVLILVSAFQLFYFLLAVVLILIRNDYAWFLFLVALLNFVPSAMVASLLRGHVRAGVVKIDSGAGTGLDYEWSLNQVQESFSFLGVGATKLTENKDAFRKMAIRCVKNGGHPPELLLCDPGSQVLHELETQAEVSKHRFTGNVQVSKTALETIEDEINCKFLIGRYQPKSKGELPLFRLLFIDKKICLISSGYYGNSDLGRSIPQLLISKDAHPGLFLVFERYFNQFRSRVNCQSDSEGVR